MPIIIINSVSYPDRFLRINGANVTASSASGGGSIDTSASVQSGEKLQLVTNPDGTVSFQSTKYSNVFLRLDGSGVTTTSNGGTVNCQFGAGAWEKYNILPQAEYGVVAIESNAWPGKYLRVDGATDENAGTFNVSGVIEDGERFKILVIG